ncbi:HugZ family protein [Maritimibacter alkaliphilus]|uniref:HugZ family pyridoxamine 5'-phosphate oxidase n=1 Tax=Maritimibacter alkaliphilus TaxID=404236 RepID=UPI001C9730FD|nr:pyridoxamine 5'-phosphate oxidase family protein [Maritimibacter alkaliphilus]MBY6091353.1 pyridoxamine 5'-phosphate oxidase family protein [Maritimibacter alkaliphilus]
MKDPIRPTDDEARALARSLIAEASFGALGVLLDGHPMVTRVALATAPDGQPLTLISTLSQHSQALSADPRCSLLLGEPGDKGDPLTHPRLTIQARADFVRQGDDAYPALAEHYLAQRPKSKLYIGFADFFFCRFAVEAAFLNGGFGKAYRLTPADLAAA